MSAPVVPQLHHGSPIIFKSKSYTVELPWLEHFRDYKNMFETGVVRANEFTS